MTRHLPALVLLAAAGPVSAAGPTVAVCSVAITGRAPPYNTVQLPDGGAAAAQLAGTGDGRRLVFVTAAAAGGTVPVTPTVRQYFKAPPAFQFADTRHHSALLTFDKSPVLDYVNEARDGSSKEAHFRTFKPFHHVFDPATGTVELTNGVHPNTKDFLYPHHRGLFFGFNKVTYGDKQSADVWHGTDNVFSQHDKVLSQEAGEVFGRQVSAISWHGKDGKPFAAEERSVTAYHVPAGLPLQGTLIDWSTTLTTTLPKVRLDGDPQHAGFHFRAANDVAKDGKTTTYYLRPDGKGKPGETRNWEPKTPDPKTVNLPWDAVSFVVAGKRYTVLRVNHPDNPKETRGSERDYGRFGDYFTYDLTPDHPLKLKYRVWVQEGEMTVGQCDALAKAFVTPPTVTLTK